MGLTIVLPDSLTGPQILRAVKEAKVTVILSEQPSRGWNFGLIRPPSLTKMMKRQADDIREVIGEAVRDQSRKMPSYQRIEDFAITRETLPRTRLAKTIPIDPVRGVFSSIASAALVLKRGSSLIWFPEGRRSPSEKLQPFRQGIGVLLEHYEVPVVPVFIKETGTALPMGSVVPKPVKVMVTFGEPVFPEQLKQSGKAKTPGDKITEGLHTIVAEMGR